MIDELKPCPFCGSKPEQYDNEYACCTGSRCPMANMVIDNRVWNTRAQPSDGALTNEGAEPVAYVLHKNGEVDWDQETVISNTGGDEQDERWKWVPVYRHPKTRESALVEAAYTLAGINKSRTDRAERLGLGCTCPSGDGSLRWPCPVHPPEVNGLPADWEEQLHSEMRRRFELSKRDEDWMCIDDTQIGVEFAADWIRACLDRVKELNS